MSHGIRSVLTSALTQAIEQLGLTVPELVVLEQPAQRDHGDLASPAAMQLIRSLTPEQRSQFQNPFTLATAIADQLNKRLPDSIQDCTVARPGFINFRFSTRFLLEQAHAMSELTSVPEQPAKDSDVVIEYVSPNTNKPLHIGHLRNAALGLSLSRLVAHGGESVKRAIIFNDRGLHIMKSCWGYLVAGRNNTAWNEAVLSGNLSEIDLAGVASWEATIQVWRSAPEDWLKPEDMKEQRLRKSDHFIGFWYQLSEQSAENESVAKQWAAMLQCWEDETHEHHAGLRALWESMNAHFYAGFEQTRQRFGFGFDSDSVSYESQIYQKGKDLVVQAAEAGIFERLPDGAVTARLEDVGLPDKILLRRDGTGIYMTFDIELTRQRTASSAKQLIWIVGEDQKLYFQQLFSVANKLGYGDVSRYYHLAYALVYLPSGKMSSRKGLVLYADDVLELAVQQARAVMEETGSRELLGQAEFDRVAEVVGIGAVKWTMLSVDPLSRITFDVASSVSFKGFAGPYVQYTYARAKSVLRQANSDSAIPFDTLLDTLIDLNSYTMSEAETDILRNLSTYYEIVRQSTEARAPHILCNYLYELCQRFNSFYASCPIISDTTLAPEVRALRLLITLSTSRVLSQGLELLGITAVEQM